ncbi:alpha/beta hydrolase fold domain-containing protein [Microbacterium sp. 179-I 3D3 NHS]|uniref:alpha/beta hydrolase fold domain-containing protein n=1 Tax=unclassified Microbacterium TaxID=2609290 RepID=UPI0039A2C962
MNHDHTRTDNDRLPVVPFDPELERVYAAMPADLLRDLTRDDIPWLRRSDPPSDEAADIAARHRTPHQRQEVEHDGVVTSVDVYGAGGAGRPGIFTIHGGGLIAGTALSGLDELLPMAAELDAVVFSTSYRLAPEHPAPAARDDALAALAWCLENAESFGVGPGRMLLRGVSAGGGLAASVAVAARDRGLPATAGLMLEAPMLDDRNETASAKQYAGRHPWNRGSNAMGWEAYLGRMSDAARDELVPARVGDLGGLPPVYLDVGSAEVFRDEVVAFASRLWRAGGEAELHVWNGGFHGFAPSAPESRLSATVRTAREGWIARLFARTAEAPSA